LPVKLQIDVQLDYQFEQPCDVLLQIEVAAAAGQKIEESAITTGAALTRVAAQDGIGTRAWLEAEGQLLVDYTARIMIERPACDYAALSSTPLHLLPGEAVQYLMPSRYCPSGQFATLVHDEFGGLEGGATVAAMREWISGHLSYVPGASDGTTTAIDTFVARQGVCRDYAHLMIALARAADIPARIASVYAPGATPPDFHAVAEVFLGGEWHIVDPTGMASACDTAIIGIGRDAGDVAFLTAFGPLELNGQSVTVREV
jgi:transglutaminase-like putative cysteine protease